MQGQPLQFGAAGPLGEEAAFEEEPLGGEAPLEEEPPPPPYHSVVLQSTVVSALCAFKCRRLLPAPLRLLPPCHGLQLAALPACQLMPGRPPPCWCLQDPASTSGRQAGSGTYGVSRCQAVLGEPALDTFRCILQQLFASLKVLTFILPRPPHAARRSPSTRISTSAWRTRCGRAKAWR